MAGPDTPAQQRLACLCIHDHPRPGAAYDHGVAANGSEVDDGVGHGLAGPTGGRTISGSEVIPRITSTTRTMSACRPADQAQAKRRQCSRCPVRARRSRRRLGVFGGQAEDDRHAQTLPCGVWRCSTVRRPGLVKPVDSRNPAGVSIRRGWPCPGRACSVVVVVMSAPSAGSGSSLAISRP